MTPPYNPMPPMTVNGIPLSPGQALTVHVALCSLAMDLRANGLGDDANGKAISEGYLRNIAEIQRLYVGKAHAT